MSFLITIIVLALIGGIIYLTQSSKKTITTREEYINALANHVEGQTEEHREYENSFRVRFTFGGYPFVYEDVELPGFKDKVNKAYLKLRISGALTLQFYEKTNTSEVISQDINLFKKAKPSEGGVRLKVHDNFKMFQIQTNNIERINKLFTNQKFVAILKKYKNTDPRGYPFMALNIVNGVIILAFYNEKRYTPSLVAIRQHIEFFEEPLKDMISLHKALNEYN